MTAETGIVLTAAGLLFTIMTVLLGLLVRIVQKWTRVEDKLDTLTKNMGELVKDKDKVHAEMVREMRADRQATNERLTYLERSVWKGIQ